MLISEKEMIELKHHLQKAKDICSNCEYNCHDKSGDICPFAFVNQYGTLACVVEDVPLEWQINNL